MPRYRGLPSATRVRVSWGTRMAEHRISTLGAIERLVLRLSAPGLVTDEVADQLGITTHEVRRYLISAMAALGARSKLEAIVLGLEHGLIRLPAG